MKNKKESGEVVIEASIVVTLVVIIISIMLYVGMVLYQQMAISIVANRTATNISQVYSNALRDPFTGYIDPDKAYKSVTYSNMETDAYLDVIRQKGTAFAQYRLKKSQIIPVSDRYVDVQIVNKPNEILKEQIIVTVKDTYEIPLVGFFGAEGKLSFSATGRADCVDYLEYLFGVEAIADPEDSVVPSLPDSDTCLVTFVESRTSGVFYAAVPVLRGKSIITSNRYSHSTMPENPVFNEMKFKGWATEKGTKFTASTIVNENLVVYGMWECTINFDPTGGVVNPTSKVVEFTKTTTFPTPTRHGYAFEGWFTEKNGAGKQYISGVTQIFGNVNLYAKWRCLHLEFDHTMTDPGNCKTKSTWVHKCKTCGYTYTDRGGYGSCEKSGRKTTVNPSCTTTGWYVDECKFCKKSMDQGAIEALGHRYATNGSDYDEKIDIKETCSKAGKIGSRCSRCGIEDIDTIEPHESLRGYCNVTHKFDRQYELYDGHWTQYGRCAVCAKCGEPRAKVLDDYRGCDGITEVQYCFSENCVNGGCNWPQALEYREVDFHK